MIIRCIGLLKNRYDYLFLRLRTVFTHNTGDRVRTAVHEKNEKKRLDECWISPNSIGWTIQHYGEKGIKFIGQVICNYKSED